MRMWVYAYGNDKKFCCKKLKKILYMIFLMVFFSSKSLLGPRCLFLQFLLHFEKKFFLIKFCFLIYKKGKKTAEFVFPQFSFHFNGIYIVLLICVFSCWWNEFTYYCQWQRGRHHHHQPLQWKLQLQQHLNLIKAQWLI